MYEVGLTSVTHLKTILFAEKDKSKIEETLQNKFQAPLKQNRVESDPEVKRRYLGEYGADYLD